MEATNADPKGVTAVGAAIREHCDGGIPECVVFAIGAIHAAAVGAAPAYPAEQNGGE